MFHGLYACGDCTGGLLQISKAVYEGTIAGLSVVNYLRKAWINYVKLKKEIIF